ncbi:MAG: DUF444 family protein [bacterium]|nr:DUF444 family protein [bacterium]
MDPKLQALLDELRAAGLTPEREAMILREMEQAGEHDLPVLPPELCGAGADGFEPVLRSLYDWHDLPLLQAVSFGKTSAASRLGSLDDLLTRDKQREADGFPRKIRVGRLVKPGKGGQDKVVVVPSTVEEKLLHDNSFQDEEEGGAGGSGDGEEGEVIGEQPVRPEQGSGTGAGEGESGQHETESSAYELGRILTEEFELPNLKNKGMKRSLTRYTYDLTDRNRGFGQLLDKKATLRKIVETNLNLGRLPDVSNIDPSEFLVSPNDRIFRVLSREKELEAQAMVFFLRDYSGSMSGKPTELVVSQHVLIYSWILYQYAGRVETRFILHDTDAREVKDFYTYYNSKVAGGTRVASAYNMVNEMVTAENLADEYNIYVFHGTDGDDWDAEGKETLPAIEKMLGYTNRVGVTVARNSWGGNSKTEVEKYLEGSGILTKRPEEIRMDVLQENADEKRLIEGIKTLIS